jgi:GNAT superfamily N-acetyltransferase
MMMSQKERTNYTLTVATEYHVPAVIDLYRQPDMDNGTGFTTEQAIEHFRVLTRYPDYSIYVAMDESEVIGTFSLAVLDNLLHGGSRSGLIEAVVVRDDMQGKGVGTFMMREALQMCLQKGCYKACLSSNMKREKAHEFYDGLGFKRHGISFMMELEP